MLFDQASARDGLDLRQLLGFDAGVNISSLELSRLSAAGEAMMFVSVDQPVPAPAVERLRADPAIVEASMVELPYRE